MAVTQPDGALLSSEFLRRLEQLELVSKKILAGRMRGDRLSKRKGRGNEFADYRPYTVGDDLRFLDWNLYGRVEKLFLRLYREEEDLHIYLLVDVSKSMDYGTPTKLRYAKLVAAALGFIGLANMDRVVAEPVGGAAGTSRGPVFRGRPSLWRLMKHLDSFEAPDGPGVPWNQSVKSITQRMTGQGVAVIISDFMDKDGYEEGLRYLTARGTDVYVVQVLAEEEVTPNFTGDLRLTDVEDGDQAEVTISAPLLERYQQTLSAFRGGLNQFCTKRGMQYLFTSNQVPFEKLVLGYLRTRGLVR